MLLYFNSSSMYNAFVSAIHTIYHINLCAYFSLCNYFFNIFYYCNSFEILFSVFNDIGVLLFYGKIQPLVKPSQGGLMHLGTTWFRLFFKSDDIHINNPYKIKALHIRLVRHKTLLVKTYYGIEILISITNFIKPGIYPGWDITDGKTWFGNNWF